MAKGNGLTDDRRSEYIDFVARPLKGVLERYYRVSDFNFFELDEHNVYKHQVLHLTKLVNKVVSHRLSPGVVEHREIVRNEVAPDLLIYAQEIYLKSSLPCWRPAHQLSVQTTCLSTLLLHESASEPRDVLALVSKASATLADYCDRKDHKQTTLHDLSVDVAIPMTDASGILMKEFGLDPDVSYHKRIEQMVEKYRGWSVVA